MRRLVLLAAGFAYMVLLIEALRATVAWWRGETEPGALDIALIGLLPILAWIWWRHLSLFRSGCGRAACIPPRRDSDR